MKEEKLNTKAIGIMRFFKKVQMKVIPNGKSGIPKYKRKTHACTVRMENIIEMKQNTLQCCTILRKAAVFVVLQLPLLSLNSVTITPCIVLWLLLFCMEESVLHIRFFILLAVHMI